MTRLQIKQVLGVVALFVFLIGFASVWPGAFFVDKGHTEIVQGVEFEIVPPHLFIKKAFQIRGENLTPAQLRIIREAMPAIASMTHQVLTRAINTSAEAQLQTQLQPRNIYQIQSIEIPVQLYLQALKNWQVTETSIQFSSDYFYRQGQAKTVNFRDTYVFTKTQDAWHFSAHPYSTPEGVLNCEKSAAGWMQCH